MIKLIILIAYYYSTIPLYVQPTILSDYYLPILVLYNINYKVDNT